MFEAYVIRRYPPLSAVICLAAKRFALVSGGTG